MDSNQYAMELVTYLLVLVVYFYELIVYMLLERNAFDSIAFFSQCIRSVWKIGLTVGMLVLAQNEPILKAVIKIGLKYIKTFFFLTSLGQI